MREWGGGGEEGERERGGGGRPTFYNFDRVQVSVPSCVKVEEFLSIPDQSAQIDR